MVALATNKLGATWVPTNTTYKGEWLEHTLSDADATLLVVDEALLPACSTSRRSPVRRGIVLAPTSPPRGGVDWLPYGVLETGVTAEPGVPVSARRLGRDVDVGTTGRSRACCRATAPGWAPPGSSGRPGRCSQRRALLLRPCSTPAAGASTSSKPWRRAARGHRPPVLGHAVLGPGPLYGATAVVTSGHAHLLAAPPTSATATPAAVRVRAHSHELVEPMREVRDRGHLARGSGRARRCRHHGRPGPSWKTQLRRIARPTSKSHPR